jgi:penicillin-binding protein 1A
MVAAMYRAPQFFGAERRSVAAPVPPRPPEAAEPPAFADDTVEYEDAPPGRSWRWRLLRWFVVLSVWSALVVGAALLWFAADLPRPETAQDATRRPSLTLQDRNGRVYATYGDVVGRTLHLNELPAYLPEAAVSVEDRRFWSHWGLDPFGIARAVLVNLRAGHVVQGGSTLTQQVAKNLFLTNARTFHRKVQEVLLTLWLEHHFSKAEILEIWLNRVYLGSGAWGVDAAAQLYFGISARKLSLPQAAVIAGLPRAPSRFSPRVDPDAAAARGRVVLQAMADAGAITQQQASEAGSQIAFPPRPDPAGWFADWAGAQSEALLPANADAVVHTTLDARLQTSVEAKLSGLLDGPGAAVNAGQGAVVVLDGATGAVRAMAGGRDRHTSSFNRAVLARRQPGSAFKPFVWLAALERGMRPDDTVLDAPVHVGAWSPANFDGKFRGEVTLEDALAESLNTVSVRLMLQAGGPRVVGEVAHRLGIGGKLPDNASLALGTAEVSLLELTGAYASFCNGGLGVTPSGIEGVESGGRTTAPFRAVAKRVVAPELAAMMVRMLGAVVSRGSGRAAAIPGRLVVGKTGTTQDYRDAWFVGCTGTSVTGVWLGNDDARPMQNVTGGSLPAKLFHDIVLDLR